MAEIAQTLEEVAAGVYWQHCLTAAETVLKRPRSAVLAGRGKIAALACMVVEFKLPEPVVCRAARVRAATLREAVTTANGWLGVDRRNFRAMRYGLRGR